MFFALRHPRLSAFCGIESLPSMASGHPSVFGWLGRGESYACWGKDASQAELLVVTESFLLLPGRSSISQWGREVSGLAT